MSTSRLTGSKNDLMAFLVSFSCGLHSFSCFSYRVLFSLPLSVFFNCFGVLFLLLPPPRSLFPPLIGIFYDGGECNPTRSPPSIFDHISPLYSNSHIWTFFTSFLLHKTCLHYRTSIHFINLRFTSRFDSLPLTRVRYLNEGMFCIYCI